MEKLPKEFKDKWVAALRSGKYRQCSNGSLTGRIVGGGMSHCCIAVAADVAGEKIDDSTTYNWLTKMIGGDEVGRLWAKNDGVDGHKPNSFHEIADYIEENL